MIGPFVYDARNAARQLPVRHLRLFLGLSADHIHHGFRGCEVHFPIEKRSSAKLAGSGRAGAGGEHAVENSLANCLPAMARNFVDVFTCVRIRRSKTSEHHLVD